MTSKERIDAFAQLGRFLEHFTVEKGWEDYKDGVSSQDHEEFNSVINRVWHHNGWFTPEMVRKALGGIAFWLKKENLTTWVSKYPEIRHPKTVAIIMAGNIPFVGFHDALCVLISGHKLLAKFSNDDNVLMPLVLQYLVQIEPRFNECIRISGDRLHEFDAVIATGSNNSARYFESYFGKYPHIIRKNRTSVAMVDGSESPEELAKLGNDIFDFFGLGCRNVTKVYVPEKYDLNKLFGAIFPFSKVLDNKKYANNYDYHKAIYMMNQDQLLENGFIVFKEDKSLYSPVGMLFYEYYNDKKTLNDSFAQQQEEIQCVVGKDHIPFGKAQMPEVDDYADGVDTMEFLAKL